MITKYSRRLFRFGRCESGATMVEYGVAMLVIVAIGVTLISALGTNVRVNVAAACSTLDETNC